MLKSFAIGSALLVASLAFGGQQDKDDKSVHHAAMHAEHTVHHNAIHAERWVKHHVSAPHKKKKTKPEMYKKAHSGSVHHAAMHAEHWLDHHVSAPHKPKPKN